jgi:hypothetical protein
MSLMLQGRGGISCRCQDFDKRPRTVPGPLMVSGSAGLKMIRNSGLKRKIAVGDYVPAEVGHNAQLRSNR